VQVRLDVLKSWKRWYFFIRIVTSDVCGQVGCWYGFIYSTHMPDIGAERKQ